MKERPIIFSGPMVRAILGGRKTQTRRAWKQPTSLCMKDDYLYESGPDAEHGFNPIARDEIVCPHGRPRTNLWVRESCWAHKDTGEIFAYCADVDEWLYDDKTVKKVPSIDMPRAASRITLEIEGVRVARLQDISEEDAKAEGAVQCYALTGRIDNIEDCRHAFQLLWKSIHGPESWDANPWVWVIEFKRIKP